MRPYQEMRQISAYQFQCIQLDRVSAGIDQLPVVGSPKNRISNLCSLSLKLVRKHIYERHFKRFLMVQSPVKRPNQQVLSALQVCQTDCLQTDISYIYFA